MSGADPGLARRGGLEHVAGEPVCDSIAIGDRMVGAVLGVDRLGPGVRDGVDLGERRSGIQVVDWVRGGALRHRDDVGADVTLTAGTLGSLTAGRGTRQWSETVPDDVGAVEVVRVWLALPPTARGAEPAWDSHDEAPVLAGRGVRATVLAGDLAGVRSPVPVHTPLVVAEVTLGPGGRAVLPLEDDYEHAVVALEGTARVDGITAHPDAMLYLGCGRGRLELAGSAGARVLLIGGEPFAESIVWRRGVVAGVSDGLE